MAKRKFCEFLVRFKWVFIGIFAALTIAGCVMIFFTDVLYDLSTYLPAKSDAYIGIDKLKQEFDDKGMIYVVVKDVTKEDAKKFAEEAGKIEGVANVVYIDLQNYINGNAMFTVSFSDYDSTKECFAATDRLMEYFKGCGHETYYAGQSASSYYTKAETEDSILKLGIVIVVIILAMLLFTGKSYFELIPLIITFGVAVALNMGTNFLFNFAGGISYVSNLVSLVLQLALSIDYSVILIHRFMEERALCDDKKEAVVRALDKGITEICSSSLTTIAGLMALVFMTLPIGREIGFSLAKGIICSLISVIFLMPALLTVFAKPMEKSIHKPFVPSVKKLFGHVIKARYILVPVFIVIVALAGAGQFFNNYSFNMNGGDYIVKNNVGIEEAGFGKINSLVVVVPKGDILKERALAEYVTSFECIDGCNALSYIQIADGLYLTDEFTKEEFEGKVHDLLTGFGMDSELLENVFLNFFAKSVEHYAPADGKISLLDMVLYLNEDENASVRYWLGDYGALLGQMSFAKSNLESDNYARMTFNIVSGVESEETFNLISELKAHLGDYYEEYYITGESVVCYDMAQYFPRDNTVVSVFTVVAVLIILLFTFRNLLLPFILILAIQGGIWLNFVIPFLTGSPMSFVGYLIICAMQMGATIDYAIVLTNRYNTIKGGFTDRYEAMSEAQNEVFPTIITSGIILTLTGAALALLSSGMVASMGSLLAIGTALSMTIVLFILPSLLLVCEKAYDKCYFKDIFKRKKITLEPAVAASVIETEPTEEESKEE